MRAANTHKRVRWVLAGAALAAAGTVLLHPAGGNMAARAANVVSAHTAPRLPLGTNEACGRYAGLPPGWRQDTRAGMVHVSSGSFTFGTTLGYPDERPAQGAGKTRVSGFWIDQTEVTNAQFAAFVTATGYGGLSRTGHGGVAGAPVRVVALGQGRGLAAPDGA